MRTPCILLFFLISTFSFSQKVNNKSISDETDVFELYAVAKPLSIKESFFVNYGQDKFRLHYYDHKTQAICDDTGKKFKKGDYLKIAKFLKLKGWKKTDEREVSIGDQKGRVVTFQKN